MRKRQHLCPEASEKNWCPVSRKTEASGCAWVSLEGWEVVTAGKESRRGGFPSWNVKTKKNSLGKQGEKYLTWRGNTVCAQRWEGRPDRKNRARGRVKAGWGGGQAGSAWRVPQRGWSRGWRARILAVSSWGLDHKKAWCTQWGVQIWSSGWGSTSDPGGGGPTVRLGVGLGVGTRSN